jgi:hypothetical protein
MSDEIRIDGLCLVMSPKCEHCEERMVPWGDTSWRCANDDCIDVGEKVNVPGVYPFKTIGVKRDPDLPPTCRVCEESMVSCPDDTWVCDNDCCSGGREEEESETQDPQTEPDEDNWDDIFLKTITEVVAGKQGCKATELAAEPVVALMSEKASITVVAAIDKLVENGDLTEVMYTVPAVEGRQKSFLLPAGSEAKVIGS